MVPMDQQLLRSVRLAVSRLKERRFLESRGPTTKNKRAEIENGR
jgi:hypothetical protein